MTRTTDWELSGAGGQPIYGTTHLPDPGSDAQGVLIVCHGFKGYKDYGLLPQLAEAAARRGFVAHRFNFSHSGMTRNVETFERPDLFECDTWGKQVEDLRVVSEASAHGQIGGEGLPQVWFGHSRGGVTAILAAADAFEADTPRVKPAGLVTAAAPHTGDRLGDEEKRLLRKHGRIESPSSRTGQVLYVGVAWLDELERDPQRCNPMRRIEQVRCPVLIVHGDNDGTVNLMSAKLLHKASRERAELRVIGGATHTFNAPNPLPLEDEPPPQTRALIDAACGFAERCCEETARP